MTHPQDTTPANPTQGVSDQMIEAATKELLAHGEFSSIPGNNEPNARIAARAALTAAIGAGWQAADSCLSPAPVQEAVAKVRRVERQPLRFDDDPLYQELSASPAPQAPGVSETRNDEAGFVEFVNSDVPYFAREIDGKVAIIFDMQTRNVIGYRVYDPEAPGVSEAMVERPLWPIDTDDQVEALARECGINNRRYMTPKDYAIWCEQQRKFARLAAIAQAPAGGAWPAGCIKPNSCSRHRACMYVNCPHSERDISSEIDAALPASPKEG